MTGRGPTDQELALRERCVRDFFGRSNFHRDRLQRAGLSRNDIRRVEDLQRLPPMRADDVAGPGDLLIDTPEPGRRNRRQYWPLQWVSAGTVPVAYSAEDLELLGGLGRDILEAAGVGGTDVLANVLPSNASRDQLQFILGAQTAGLSFATFGTGATPQQLAAIAPTVIAGEIREITRLLDAASAAGSTVFERIHTLFVVGSEPTSRAWKKLSDLLDSDLSRVVRTWAPDGVFSLWTQCRSGEGFHTWSTVEVVEIVDPLTGLPVPEGVSGSIVWTGLEWYATAMLRLHTGAFAAMTSEPCADCGRISPRLLPQQQVVGFPAVLDANPHVEGWFAELQRVSGEDELVIWVSLRDTGQSLHVLADVDSRIGGATVQMVDLAEVERRRIEAKGERFGDRRAVRFG